MVGAAGMSTLFWIGHDTQTSFYIGSVTSEQVCEEGKLLDVEQVS